MRVFDGFLKGSHALLAVSKLLVALSCKDYQRQKGKKRFRIKHILRYETVRVLAVVLDIALINF